LQILIRHKVQGRDNPHPAVALTPYMLDDVLDVDCLRYVGAFLDSADVATLHFVSHRLRAAFPWEPLVREPAAMGAARHAKICAALRRSGARDHVPPGYGAGSYYALAPYRVPLYADARWFVAPGAARALLQVRERLRALRRRMHQGHDVGGDGEPRALASAVLHAHVLRVKGKGGTPPTREARRWDCGTLRALARDVVARARSETAATAELRDALVGACSLGRVDMVRALLRGEADAARDERAGAGGAAPGTGSGGGGHEARVADASVGALHYCLGTLRAEPRARSADLRSCVLELARALAGLAPSAGDAAPAPPECVAGCVADALCAGDVSVMEQLLAAEAVVRWAREAAAKVWHIAVFYEAPDDWEGADRCAQMLMDRGVVPAPEAMSKLSVFRDHMWLDVGAYARLVHMTETDAKDGGAAAYLAARGTARPRSQSDVPRPCVSTTSHRKRPRPPLLE